MSRAENYGLALYNLAREEDLVCVILGQMEMLEEAFCREPDFLRLLGAPNLPKEVRCGILEKIFRGKIEHYLLNVLKLLTEKGCIRDFSRCFQAYRRAYHDHRGILCVKAVSARPLEPRQKQRLVAKLENMTGKTIQLTNPIDPAVLGGIRLEYGGMQVDGTVKSRLDSMARLLKKEGE